jgi:HAMP domain-containing protein
VANQRKRIWIDGFQTRLIVRLIFYCIGYQAALWVILMVLRAICTNLELVSGQPQPNYLGVPALLAILGLLGLMTYDAVRYVHRLVGPVYRFRTTIQAINAGDPIDPIRLRKDDYLKDLANDFNQMLQLLHEKGAIVLRDPTANREQVAAR